MKGSIKLITIKGITVYLHVTFLFFVGWMIMAYVASGMQWVQLFWSVLFLFAVFASIILHEYGHALVAAFFGINAKRITIYPIGGIASIEKLPENPRQELLISAAGPVVSFCLAALLFLFAPQEFSFRNLNEFSADLNKENLLFALGFVNIAVAVFNLIPAFPMDGGRILRALLAFRFNYIKATAIATQVGKITAFVVIAWALLTMNFILSLVGVFIIVFARAEESYLQLKSLVRGIRLKEVLMYDYNSIEAELTVNEAANIMENNHSKYFIVMEEGNPVGTLNRMEVMKAVAEENYNKRISDLMRDNLVYLDGEMWLDNILDKFSGHEERIYPVFDNERFIGVVSFRHIIEYLLLHKVKTKEYNKTRSLVELV